MKKKTIKAWAIVADSGRTIGNVYRDREDALYDAQDVGFMGTRGAPQEVIRVEVTYEL